MPHSSARTSDALSPMPDFRSLIAVVTIALSFVVAGCNKPAPSSESEGPTSGGTATASPAAADCATVDAPLTNIPPGDGEPALSIPQPPGWEPAPDVANEIISFAMVNRGLVSAEFAPTAVVTHESVEGEVPADDIFESNRSTLTSAGGTDLTVTPSTVCGLSAERVEYTCPTTGQVGPRPCRLLSVVSPTRDRTFLFTVTVQTTDPTNPTYQRDSDAILEGFRVTAPPA